MQGEAGAGVTTGEAELIQRAGLPGGGGGAGDGHLAGGRAAGQGAPPAETQPRNLPPVQSAGRRGPGRGLLRLVRFLPHLVVRTAGLDICQTSRLISDVIHLYSVALACDATEIKIVWKYWCLFSLFIS